MGGKQVDLTKKKFGELEVIRSLGHGTWECQCSCGKKKVYRTYTLTHGDAVTCGHGKLLNKGEDLTGRQFGKWTVLGYDGRSKWKCQCSCDDKTIKSVRGSDLKNGKSQSCGCGIKEDLMNQVIGDFEVIGYNKEVYKWICKCTKCGEIALRTKYDLINRHNSNCSKRIRYEDLKGKHFGEWEALEYMGDYTWKCKCSCGTIRSVSRYDLITGGSTNCGCKRMQDLTDRTFGRLHVIELSRKDRGIIYWKCQCSCDAHNIVEVSTGNLLNGGTKSCGCLKNESHNSKEEYI